VNREKFPEICSGLGENWGSFEPNLVDYAQIECFFLWQIPFSWLKFLLETVGEKRHELTLVYLWG
jgi:hypothetical protein